MSTLSNSKEKNAGRKYTSLNLNQTFKGSKSESKSISGQNTRQHGLQSLGKIQSRRAPVPANLPSLKRENLGNDPRVNIVPTGSQGWAKKGNSQNTKADTTVAQSLQSTAKEESKEISLRPNAGLVPQHKSTEEVHSRDNVKATWGNTSQSSQQSGQSTYFTKEFPTLDGKDADGMSKMRDQLQGSDPGLGQQEVERQVLQNGQNWMDKQIGPMPVPPNLRQHLGDHPMYNGGQPPMPFPYPQMFPSGQSGRGMHMPPFPFFYPPPGGKIQIDPNLFPRMAEPSLSSRSKSHPERPSVVKDAELNSLDPEGEKDDSGWAGAQEEVDYNAKLKFDESDDSDDETLKSNVNKELKSSNHVEDAKRFKAYTEYMNSPEVQMALNQQNWQRMQHLQNFDPQRGPPGTSHGYPPIHPMYFMPFAYSQNLPPSSQDISKDPSNDLKERESKERSRVIRPDDKKDLDRKAAAQAKLKELEEKLKKRTPEEQKQLEDAERARRSERLRNDSEASDSSKREVPPRFRRPNSGQQNVCFADSVDRQRTTSESSKVKIMQRKDSNTSEGSVSKDDEFVVTSSTAEPNFRKSQQSKGKHERETESFLKNDKDFADADTSNKEDKVDGYLKTRKKELRNLSDKNSENSSQQFLSKEKGESELEIKRNKTSEVKPLSVHSQRFQDMKLTKNQLKHDKSQEKRNERNVSAKNDNVEPKVTSVWSKVVSDGNTFQKEVDTMTLTEIQKEEEKLEKTEERESLCKQADVASQSENVDRLSPTENKFRSDFYAKKESQEDKHEKLKTERRGRFSSNSGHRQRTDRDTGHRRSERSENRRRDDNKDYNRYDSKEDNRHDGYENSRRERNTSVKTMREDTRRDRLNDYDDIRRVRKGERVNHVGVNLSESVRKEFKDGDKVKFSKTRNENMEMPKVSTDNNDAEMAAADTKKTELVKDSRQRPKREERRNVSSYEDNKQSKYDRRADVINDQELEKKDTRRENSKPREKEKSHSYKEYDRKRDSRQSAKDEDKGNRRASYKDSYSKEKDRRQLDQKERSADFGHEKKRHEWNTKDYRQSEDYHRDYSYAKKKGDWNNKDYRQSEEYQRAVKAKEKERAVETTKFVEKVMHSVQTGDVESVNSTENDEQVKTGEVKPQLKQVAKTHSYEIETSYVSKGRDSSIDKHAYRDKNSTQGKRRGYSQSTKRDNYYEDVSSGDFTDDDDEQVKTRPKSAHYKDKKKLPPRFQTRQNSEFNSRGRGRGRGRGHRGGHAGFMPPGRNGSGSGQKNEDGDTKLCETKDFNSVEESIVFESYKAEQQSDDMFENYRGRGRRSRGGGSGFHRRDHSSTVPRNKQPFLGKRQQVGSRTSTDKKEASSAADKTTVRNNEVPSCNNETQHLGLEDTSSNISPKKLKPPGKKDEKKRDISREYDLNNIRSVVCIDFLDLNVDQKLTVSEEDGFVTVTSKKQQKEMRDRQREEEKRKLFLLQKKEKDLDASANRSRKSKKDQKQTIISTASLVSFADAPTSSISVEHIAGVCSASETITVTAAASVVPSNAAMAAIGLWEPAQMLSRDVSKHHVTTTSSSSVSAWQRPLSLSASIDSTLPDPRAVGTGKPTSHPGLVNKVTLISTQPTPEAASPLVTPPALAPIGSSLLGNSTQSKLEVTGKPIENKEVKEKKDFSTSKESERSRAPFDENRKRFERNERSNKNDKSTNKRIVNEKAPRFQSNASRTSDRSINERSKNYDDRRKKSGNKHYNDKAKKHTSDRQKKVEQSKSDGKEVKSKPITEIISRDEEDGVFFTDVPSGEVPRRSKLSDAEKVVGSNKPLKSQSSVGSYSGDVVQEEKIEPVKMHQSYKKPTLLEMTEELKASPARSVVKSLSNENDRTFETRSLPGTPPLAVKIPEPQSMTGPSSDPGKGPSSSVTKDSTSSIDQEMSDMNRRLLSAKKVWDDSPTSWSDSAVVSTKTGAVSSNSIQSKKEKSSNLNSTATKTEATASTSVSLDQTGEKVTSSNSTFTTKRTEQQVCKVKPQQQIHHEEVSDYHQTNHNTNVVSSKYGSYVLPVERQMQQNLYSSDVNFSDHFRGQTSPALTFQNLTGHVRSVDASVSSMIHQDLILSSFPVGYGTPTLSSQNQLLAWQMASNGNVQSAKTMTTYQNSNQASLFTSSGSLCNSPLIMQYNSNYSPQRSSSNVQRQSISMVPMQQQQASLRIMHPGNHSHVRQSQQYQGLNDGLHTNNPNQITMVLDPTQGNLAKQMTQQQRSDLMKHVHAKPFEPTSQTPPLIQSPPIMAQQNVQPFHQNHMSRPQPQQHAGISSAFNQSSSNSRHQYIPNVTRYTQPIMQQQHAVHPVHPIQQSPLVASVRPQSVQGRMLSSAKIPSNLDRVNNLAAMEPTLALLSANMNNQHQSTNSNVQMLMNQHPRNNQYNQNGFQPQYQNSFNMTSARAGPGPIQRPVAQLHSSALNTQGTKAYAPVTAPRANATKSEVDFKKIQRLKMLEDTKRYFDQDSKQSVKPVTEEKPPETTPVVNPELSKHEVSKERGYDKKSKNGQNRSRRENHKAKVGNAFKSSSGNNKKNVPKV